MLSLEELFCDVDDFCQIFEPLWRQELLSDGRKRRKRQPKLSLSEMMTIQIAFHQSSYRNFKPHPMLNHRHGRLNLQKPTLSARPPNKYEKYVPVQDTSPDE